MIQFMSSIRDTIESLNLVLMESRWRLGAAKVMATVNLTIQRRSQSIRPPTRFMSPIQLTSEYRYLTRMENF